MKYKKLIDVSRTFLEMHPPFAAPVFCSKVFDTGAKWMFDKLQEMENKPDMKFNSSINFYAYGLLKYSISIFAFLFSVFVFLKINLFLLPLSVLIFYLVEVHFLFLFPVLIDNIKNPVCTSIKLTYKAGIVTTLANIIPIGFFMMFGFLRFKDPFRNWYIGCLAIIIWYQDEIRNRL